MWWCYLVLAGNLAAKGWCYCVVIVFVIHCYLWYHFKCSINAWKMPGLFLRTEGFGKLKWKVCYFSDGLRFFCSGILWSSFRVRVSILVSQFSFTWIFSFHSFHVKFFFSLNFWFQKFYASNFVFQSFLVIKFSCFRIFQLKFPCLKILVSKNFFLRIFLLRKFPASKFLFRNFPPALFYCCRNFMLLPFLLWNCCLKTFFLRNLPTQTFFLFRNFPSSKFSFLL